LHILWNNRGSREQNDDDGNDIKATTSQYVDYNGKYYQLEKISIAPKPFQKPHPPIFIRTWGSSEAAIYRKEYILINSVCAFISIPAIIE
jgi:alkanesulfonate monooxygenase SsuD/methylene tetrahydromethanopterin reductase-like flavin-dependent oxidoreductase (luciferase family)